VKTHEGIEDELTNTGSTFYQVHNYKTISGNEKKNVSKAKKERKKANTEGTSLSTSVTILSV
jgi:hypothetical protein